MVTYRVDQLVGKSSVSWQHVGTFTLVQANKRYGKIEFQEMQQGHLPNFVVTPIASNGFLLQGE